MLYPEFCLPFTLILWNLISIGRASYVIEASLSGYYRPQQVHSSLGNGYENEFVITWVTTNRTFNSMVHFGHDLNLTQSAIGKSDIFVDQGEEQRVMWIHRVHLKNLASDLRYAYKCGSDQVWSKTFFFKTMKSGTNWSPKLALYGDLGLVNPQSLGRLQKEAQGGMYDAIIHVGDFAYDMHDDNSRVGDAFMNIIEPIAAYLPYMTCPGNHEEKHNFENYKARFSMPGYQRTQNMFYSWNLGPAHFIAVNTEAYYFWQYGIQPLIKMYRWLVADLKEATRPEIRLQRPWIVIYGHRPMYCSNTDGDDCSRKFCLTRVGLPFLHWFGLEKLLKNYGVDVVIWAHEHSYERLWPLFDFEVKNGTEENPYVNPK